MFSPSVIFDLDDTIVNTSALMALRNAKKWRECTSQLFLTKLFHGVLESFTILKSEGIKIGIVTASVSYYAEAVLQYHHIPYDSLICYHDCPRPKPAPDPIIMCLTRLSGSREKALGIGDAIVDAVAYKAAGIPAWGAGWSTTLDRSASWDHVALNPEMILDFFKQRP